MTTLEKLEAVVKNAGLRVGKPILEVINDVGDADIATWQREIRDRDLTLPKTSDLELIKNVAPRIFGTDTGAEDAAQSWPEAGVNAAGQSQTVAGNIETAPAPSAPVQSAPVQSPPAQQAPAPKLAQPDALDVIQFSTASAPPVPNLSQVRFDRTSDGSTILTWDPYTSDQQVAYLVVGGSQEIDLPIHEARLAATLQPRILLPTVPRFVSIFAYEGADLADAEIQPARLIAMGEMVPDVEIIVHNAAARSITLQWANPSDVSGNLIFRSLPNKPLSIRYNPDEVVDLTMARIGRGMENGREVFSFTDSDLVPGARYEYRIHAVVDLPNGTRRQSRGVVAELTTTEQLMPVAELYVQPVPSKNVPIISLIWKAPEFGDVVIVHSINDPNAEILATGTGLKPTTSLSALGDTVLQKPDAFQGGFAKISRLELPEPDFTNAKNGLMTHCFTAVTMGRSGFVIGKTVSVPMIAAVGVSTLVDRVEWQLVRLRWPVGAAFLQVEASRTTPGFGGQVEILERKTVSRDEFSRVGGVMLTNLHGTPATITVWGVCPNGTQADKGQNYTGIPAVLDYPGHRLLRYMVRTSDGLRRKSEYQLLVEREGEWPDHETLMLAGGSKCPLTLTNENLVPDLARIGVVNIEHDSLQEGVLTPVTMTPLPDADRRPPYLRLLSKPTQVASERPMLAWKVPPGAKAEPPAPPGHGSVCPECFTELPPTQRLFVCTGLCPEIDDNQRVSRLAQGGAKIRQLTIADAKIGPKGQIVEPPPSSVACAGCGRTTSQVICPVCHAKLPPAWSDTDLLTVSIAGTKGSGKSVFVWSLLPYLKDNLIKRLGGGMQPAANSESARAKMDEISRVTQTWTYPDATPWLTQNPVLRLPLLFNVGSILNAPVGHLRAMSFFDTAGEMLEDPTGAMSAGEFLTHSDLVVMMLDMRQIDIVRDVLAIQDKPSDVSPSALLTNLLTAIGHPARMPKLAIVLNQFDLVHRAANLDGRVAEILNLGDAIFQDPYAVAENQDKLYLPDDGALVDAECRQFLAYAGQSGFVKQVETYQGRCQFFAVSAVGGDPRDKAVPEDGISPFRVADPIRWAMYEQWATSGRGRGGR